MAIQYEIRDRCLLRLAKSRRRVGQCHSHVCGYRLVQQVALLPLCAETLTPQRRVVFAGRQLMKPIPRRAVDFPHSGRHF
jgi:hypothetical protein